LQEEIWLKKLEVLMKLNTLSEREQPGVEVNRVLVANIHEQTSETPSIRSLTHE